MGAYIDISGLRFGRLTAIERHEKTRDGKTTWWCICDCGTQRAFIGTLLRSGHTKSCGCFQVDETIRNHTTHGKSHTYMHRLWTDIRNRCNNPRNKSYPFYGGRGIKVCERWEADYSNFVADLGTPPPGMQIDRIDNDRDYGPDNCRWTTRAINCRNRRNNHIIEWNGQRRCIKEWSELTGISRLAISQRINKLNWPIEKALTTPAQRRKKPNG